METADDIFALPDRIVAPLDQGQWAFRVALLVAVLCHAALFIEIGRSAPRTLGDQSGAQDAISVEIVSSADLKSRETVALPPQGAPAPPVAPPVVAPQPQAEAEPQSQTQPQPQPASETQPEPPPAPAAKAETPPDAPAPEPAPVAKEPEPAKEAPVVPKLADVPSPEPEPAPSETQERPAPDPKASDAKSEETRPPEKAAEPPQAASKAPAAKKAPPPQKQARLQPPSRDFESAPPGRSAGATRPPGITRSGENDAFGREVIRALRSTMPPPRGIYGYVTVRLLLTENGDLAEVRIVDSSGTRLDQDVVFATKQTYFPLPPYKSTALDRTFVVRYLYR